MKPFFYKPFFIAGLLALLMVTVMAIQGAALKTADTPSGILDLEFAKTSDNVERILIAWKYLNNTALWNTLIDFGFLASYTFFFSRGIFYVSTIMPQSFLQKKQGLFCKVAVIPGLLDAVENGFMLGWLLNIVPTFSPVFVYWMVWVKFMLAALFLAICLPAWLYNGYLGFKKND